MTFIFDTIYCSDVVKSLIMRFIEGVIGYSIFAAKMVHETT